MLEAVLVGALGVDGGCSRVQKSTILRKLVVEKAFLNPFFVLKPVVMVPRL